jgi:hypothetical protein
MQEKFPITNIFVKYFFSYIFIIVFSILFTGIFRNIFGFMYPEELGGSFFDVRFSFDNIYGFVFSYSFFIPLILIPVFFSKRIWLKILIPYLPILVVAFLFLDQAFHVSIIFFVIGILLGLFAVWLRKKI